MASQPDITFRDATSPYSLLSSLSYIQTAPSGDVLPVLSGQNSDRLFFRIYNNFALASGVASAVNVRLTVYDGIGSGSHTCSVLPVSQSWFRIQEYGYGENSVTSPDYFTAYLGSDTAIGGNNPCGGDTYTPEVGSDSLTFEPKIRAYSNGNGMGYIEFSSYVSVPNSSIVQNQTYTFAVSISYEWFS